MANHDVTGHRRRSTRLRGYDYSQPGAYFVTICTQDRAALFGEIKDGEMRLNDAGRMVERWWVDLANKFQSVKIDKYVVMPNHFDGIVSIVGADLGVCPGAGARNSSGEKGAHVGAPLPQIIQWFKSMTTNEYIRGVRRLGWPAFSGKLWQRGYYDHIIRSDQALDRIREYIVNNPAKWGEDPENPDRISL